VSDPKQLIEQLLAPARAVAENAYSPYSDLRFGAAALTRDGRIIIGCNVENASYSITQCAEIKALGAAVSQGVQRGDIVAMLIFTPGDITHSPCGACRQAIKELLAPDGQVIATSGGGEPLSWKVSEILPNAFELTATELAHERN
jgi:cytidine deaminase